MGKSVFVIFDEVDDFIGVAEDREKAEMIVSYLDSASNVISTRLLNKLHLGSKFSIVEIELLTDTSQVEGRFDSLRSFYSKYLDYTDEEIDVIARFIDGSRG